MTNYHPNEYVSKEEKVEQGNAFKIPVSCKNVRDQESEQPNDYQLNVATASTNPSQQQKRRPFRTRHTSLLSAPSIFSPAALSCDDDYYCQEADELSQSSSSTPKHYRQKSSLQAVEDSSPFLATAAGADFDPFATLSDDEEERGKSARRNTYSDAFSFDFAVPPHPSTIENHHEKLRRSVCSMADELRRCLLDDDESEESQYQAASMTTAADASSEDEDLLIIKEEEETLILDENAVPPQRRPSQPLSAIHNQRQQHRLHASTRSRTMSLYELHPPGHLL